VNRKYIFASIILVIIVVLGAVVILTTKESPETQPLATPTPTVTIEVTPESVATVSATPVAQVDKLIIQDEEVGTGEEAVAGKKVTVNYVGTLTDGTQFDSSYGKTPFTFTLGAGEVIPGWDQGVAGMRVGGKRKLTIPASLGYGSQGIPGAIPGGATLIFEVELLGVE
jgi:FKBP-type peptidyl-prolyl cis-trans isomerase